jgi:hypothetical protein
VLSITDCVQGVTEAVGQFLGGIHDRESREHIRKTRSQTKMSLVVQQSSGDQPNVMSGWREARIPRFKAEGIAD